MGIAQYRMDKILLATDFSNHSQVALARAADFAEAFQASILAVHCLPDLAFVPSASEFGLRYNDYALMQEEFSRDATEAMRKFLEGTVSKGINASSKILVGDPHIELSLLAEKEKFDLVIAGRSGHSGWEDFLLGSTSRGLVHRCPTSVMAVSDQWDKKPRTILASTDFSELSKVAVIKGLAIADKLGAKMHLLHVIDTTDTPAKSVTRMTTHETIRQSINDYAQSRLETFVKALEGDSTEIELHLSWGTPWRVMCQTAENIHADLILIGNAGRRGVQGFFVGNTAERVLTHCKTSVLAVKA